MSVKELHRESMRFIDLALLARFDNAIDKVKENYLKAFELEKKAFLLFSQVSNQEPTRSILIRSAANLAILSEQFREAEKLIAIGLAGDISEEIANEFRDLFQNVNFYRHLELDAKEVQFTQTSGVDIEIEGILSFADAKKNKIKLSNNKVTFEIEVPKGLLSDVVKPFFEDYVIVKGIKNGKKIILKDIKSKEKSIL